MSFHILRAGILQIMVLVMTMCRLVCEYTFKKKILPSSSSSHYISNFTLHVRLCDGSVSSFLSVVLICHLSFSLLLQLNLIFTLMILVLLSDLILQFTRSRHHISSKCC